MGPLPEPTAAAAQAGRAEPTASVDDDLILLRQAAAALDAVEGAMRRIDSGTYGVCSRCGTSIDDADLAADPLVTGCALHRGG